MAFHILAINPGSTSTKFAWFEDDKQRYFEEIGHSDEELDPFERLVDQMDFRKELLLGRLVAQNFDLTQLNAVAGRGGMLPPVHGGGYRVNRLMKDRLRDEATIPHASNLGALIADAIAAPLGVPAYIYDAVSSDELRDIARITGLPEVARRSFTHVLNTRAMARKLAAQMGRRYEDINLIMVHMGGGISLSAHERGRIVDVITDSEGPFSPKRAGSLPLNDMMDICYSGRYSKAELTKMLRRDGGLEAHLGTHDGLEIERRIAAGDEKAAAVYAAMAYRVSKGIGELAPALSGRIDAIVLTGGLARSGMLTDWIAERVGWIAPVVIMPGQDEMEALALGVLRILRGEESASEYDEQLPSAGGKKG